MAGQISGLIKDIKPVQEIIKDIVEEYNSAFKKQILFYKLEPKIIYKYAESENLLNKNFYKE